MIPIVHVHGLLAHPWPCLGPPTQPETLVTWSNFISGPSSGGTPLFISFHPRSSIQYNMCYERKYCTIDQSEFKFKFTNYSAADLLSSTVPFASAACNPTLRFLYKLFYNFWHNHSQCHQHKGTPCHFHQILRQLITLDVKINFPACYHPLFILILLL